MRIDNSTPLVDRWLLDPIASGEFTGQVSELSYPAPHKGRKGKVGGSEPRDAGDVVADKPIVVGSLRSQEQTDNVKALFNSLPEGETRGIKTFQLSREEGPLMTPDASEWGRFTGTYIPATQELSIFANAKDPERTLIHEVGHNIERQLIHDQGKEGKKAWIDWEKWCRHRYSKFKFLSGYDSMVENPSETFAEAYRLFRHDYGSDRAKFHDFLADNEGIVSRGNDLDVEPRFFKDAGFGEPMKTTGWADANTIWQVETDADGAVISSVEITTDNPEATRQALGLPEFSYPAPHKGRPGEVGGSKPRDAGVDTAEDDPFDTKAGSKFHEWWWNDLKYLRDTKIEDAIWNYCDGGYEPINAYLRGKRDSMDSFNHETVDMLDGYLQGAHAPENMMIYRGTTLSGKSDASKAAIARLSQWASQGEVGGVYAGVFTDPAFSSGTTNKRIAESFSTARATPADAEVNYVIEVPKGTRVVPVFNQGINIEQEVLFPRGAKFGVQRVNLEPPDSRRYFPRYTVYMRALP